jgi:hypothetical protein
MLGKIKKNRGLEENDHDRMNIVYGLKYEKFFSEPHGLCSKIRHMCQLLLQERRNETFLKASPWLLFFLINKF